MVRFGHCSALATINPHELFLSFIEFISFVLIERLVLSVFRLWISFGPLSFESSIRNDQLHETFVRFVRTVEIRKRFKVRDPCEYPHQAVPKMIRSPSITARVSDSIHTQTRGSDLPEVFINTAFPV